MRSGGYTLHHSLTVEAAGVVKQAVTLARRRGHAQVSPLHVASAMLASPAGLLKRACLQSHSHPLQCKALELCFNVALNRLPTSASAPLLGPHSHLPSLSNALVAAFKRAQAHQRRGSIENQQQPILALKVEIEQLVISVLDDPSVSRVMREAGFSSTQVKANVENALSLDKCTSQPPPPPPPLPAATNQSKEMFNTLPPKNLLAPPTMAASANLSQFRYKAHAQSNDNDTESDVMTVLEAMSNKKTKNAVIVGECAATSERLVKKVMEKFDSKDVPHDMKSVQFISVPLLTLRNVSKEEFEVKLGELRSLVKSYVGRGVVLYLGDLDWVSEFWCKYGEQRNVFYSPVEYMIMELSRLVCGSGDSYKRLWLMGTATFQTYAKCKSGRPSLETLWSLYPLTLPLGTLALGLSLNSGMHDEVKKEPLEDSSWLQGMKKQLVCCWDCADSFKKEAEAVTSGEHGFVSDSSASRLPSWLQQYKDEKKQQLTINQESDKIKDLCEKWNSICSSVHKKPHFLEKVFNLSSSSSPSSSTSASSSDIHHNNKSKIQLNWPAILDRGGDGGEVSKPAAKPELLSNPNSSPNSASSSEASDELTHKFDEFNSEDLRVLTAALEKKVPRQKHIVSDIVTAVVKCRSGATRSERRETWLSFLGADSNGKEAMAKELARVVFGSLDDFVAVGISSFATEGVDSAEEVASCRKKRGRNEHGGGVYDRFLEAVRDNPSRLFYVEDVDQIEQGCVKKFEGAMRDGGVLVGDEFLPLKDAIVVFSCDSSIAPVDRDHGKMREKDGEEDGDGEEQCGPLDLNVATEDGNAAASGIRILDAVDMQVVFRIQVL